MAESVRKLLSEEEVKEVRKESQKYCSFSPPVYFYFSLFMFVILNSQNHFEKKKGYSFECLGEQVGEF